jgi:peptidoglycan/LPS O-acetylase OafA/YrhL
MSSSIYGFLPDDKNFGGGYSMFAALSLFLLVISNEKFKKYLSLPFLQFLGGISYGLYVVHFLIIGSFSSWLFLLLSSYFSFNISFLFVLLTGLPFIIFAAYLLTRYVDNPVIGIANRIGNRVIKITASSIFKEWELLVKRNIMNKFS